MEVSPRLIIERNATERKKKYPFEKSYRLGPPGRRIVKADDDQLLDFRVGIKLGDALPVDRRGPTRQTPRQVDMARLVIHSHEQPIRKC